MSTRKLQITEDSSGKAFSRRLYDAMERHGITQAELARMVGTSRQVLGSWVRGRTRPPFEHLTTMADILDVSVGWLITGKEPKHRHGPLDLDICAAVAELTEAEKRQILLLAQHFGEERGAS